MRSHSNRLDEGVHRRRRGSLVIELGGTMWLVFLDTVPLPWLKDVQG